MPNIPPIPEDRLKKIVDMVYKDNEILTFPRISDEEVLEIVKQFLNMRKWVENAKFPLLCLACKEPMNYVGFTYRGENFLFWHCWKCHANPDFEKSETHITFEEFKKVLDEIIKERNKRRGTLGQLR